jgi:hypothetical protein
LSFGEGDVDGDGNGGGAPWLVVVFDFVLFGAEFFVLGRDAFGFGASTRLATAGTSALAATTPACGNTCVPAGAA